MTPHRLAGILAKRSSRLAMTDPPSAITAEANGAGFYVYDNDGGVLHVSVTQYKEPIR